MSVNKKMKLFQLILFSAFLAAVILPIANAEIKVQSASLQNVTASVPPDYGVVRFMIVVTKTTANQESAVIPVIVNGTTLSNIAVTMNPKEMTKTVQANVTLPGASVLIVNPFTKLNPIPVNIIYPVYLDPYANPISSVQYIIKVGDFTRPTTLLIYADWTIWAIVIDIIAVAAMLFFITRTLLTS
jgi:hypothetical protein